MLLFSAVAKTRKRMPAGRSRIAVAAVVILFVFLPGCHSHQSSDEPQYIMLTFNGGSCQQNGSTGIIDVEKGQAVIYQGASILRQFRVGFATCPFVAGDCPVDSPNGNSMNLGKPNPNAAGSTFMYSGLSMDNQPCTNSGQMGLRVKP